MFDFQSGNTPLTARTNFPVIMFGLAIFAIAAGILLVWFISKKIIDWSKSEKHIAHIAQRKTTSHDIKTFAKKHSLPKDQTQVLANMCQAKNVPNFNFYVQDSAKTFALFKDYYSYLRQTNATEEKISAFFRLLFNMEKNIIQQKTLSSTRQIPVPSIIFLYSQNKDQYPFNMSESTADYFSLEIPIFAEARGLTPKALERLPLIYKNPINGISYHFTSRVIRIQNTPEGKKYLICSHSEDLASTSHRNYRREEYSDRCIFSPAQVSVEATRKRNNTYKYTALPQKYVGILKDISGGGCCIKTQLPIKEQQLISVDLSATGINEQIVGTIKKTRRLADGKFALHIKFIDISLKAQNRILALVYKYEI